MINWDKPYGTVWGGGASKYEQDGKSFNAKGEEIISGVPREGAESLPEQKDSRSQAEWITQDPTVENDMPAQNVEVVAKEKRKRGPNKRNR